MSFNHVESIVPTVTVGAGSSAITPERLTFAAGAIGAGVAGTGAVVIGAIAPVPSTIALVATGVCLYSAYRMENDLPIIPSFGNNAPTEPVTVERPTVDVTPVSA